MGQTGLIMLSMALIQILETDGWRLAPSSTSPHPLWRCASIFTQRCLKELIGFNSLALQCQVLLFVCAAQRGRVATAPIRISRSLLYQVAALHFVGLLIWFPASRCWFPGQLYLWRHRQRPDLWAFSGRSNTSLHPWQKSWHHMRNRI